MTTTRQLNTFTHITLDGAQASADFNNSLASIEIDGSLYLPAMFVIRLNDPELKWVDDSSLAIGTAITISMVDSLQGSQQLIEGEITALEPEFTREGFIRTVVRGYDKSHRLQRVRATKTFLQMTDSDIASSVIGSAGLQANCTATSALHDYVLRDNETAYDFLQRLARRNGFVVVVDGGKVTFGSPGGDAGSSVATLEFGTNLREFRPRLTAAAQADSGSVYGWDPKQKDKILGTASTPASMNSLGTDGHSAASKFGSTGELAVVDIGVADQGDAQERAKALLTRARTGDVHAHGVCSGNAKLKPGVKVDIKTVGTRFSGTYTIGRSLHRYDAIEGYITEFDVSNGSGETAATMVAGPSPVVMQGAIERNVVIGVVTDNNDAQGGLSRVKVKFPWMPPADGTEIESAWARLSAPMAGSGRGVLFFPEIGDEVLVAFDHGDPTRPYVIGALWNGQDAPPVAQNTAIVSSKVEQRMIRRGRGTRCCSMIRTGALASRSLTPRQRIPLSSTRSAARSP